MPVDIRTMSGHFNGPDIQITGASLSGDQIGQLQPTTIPTVPTAAGTTEVLLIATGTGIVSAVRVLFKEGLVASDVNLVDFRFRNVSQASADIILATAVNSTRTTGGSALTALTVRSLSLTSGVSVTKNDVLSFTIVTTGTLPNTLTLGRLQANVLVTA